MYKRTVIGTALQERLGVDASRELEDGFGRIVTQMAEMKVDILRWSFAFWVGQVAVTLALVALFARLLKA